MIDRGVYVYNGQFNLGAAAALEHVHTAQDFEAQHDASGSVREARIAENFDPNNPEAHVILGDSFAAAGDKQQRRLSTLRHSIRQSSILFSRRAYWLSCKQR